MALAELDRGCHGDQVKLLQHLLNTAPQQHPTLRLDGVFGPRTEDKVRVYQGRHALSVDGVVGARTWAALGLNQQELPRPVPQPASRPQAAARPVVAPAPALVKPLTPHFTPPGRVAPPIPAAAPAVAAVPRAVPLPASGPTTIAPDAPWMAVAQAEKWVHEKTPNGTKRIIEYHATTCGAHSDQVAWCSSFVNWCLKQVHVRGTNSAAAASWAHWGTPLTQGRYGCIVQLHNPKHVHHDPRTGSSSGNHVGFFVSGTATHVTLLGGNQSNQVKVSSFPIADYHIAAMRWPG